MADDLTNESYTALQAAVRRYKRARQQESQARQAVDQAIADARRDGIRVSDILAVLEDVGITTREAVRRIAKEHGYIAPETQRQKGAATDRVSTE